MSTVATGFQSETIDAAIDAALGGLEARMRGHGASFEALSASMRRAASGGKRFRPALVVRAFRALDGDADSTPALLPIAVAFELLHTAFVVHDDVIDGDTVRRGEPNVSGEFRQRAHRGGADASGAAALGDAAAILAGDLLLHEAQRMVALSATAHEVRTRLLDLLDEAIVVSAAGELADVEQAVLALNLDVAGSLTMSRNKTAVYSFGAPLRAGAALAGATPETDAALDRCGSRLGLAFQLVDDLIGAFGTSLQAGRDAGSDLVTAKRTPLVALAQDTGSWPVVSGALTAARTGPIAVREAQRALDESGARQRLEDLVRELVAESRDDAAATLPGGLPELIDELAALIEGRIP